MEKKAIRDHYKTLRNNMTPEQVKTLSGQICARILASDFYRSAEKIYAYYPLGNEADIRMVIADALKRGRRVAFPRVHGKEMAYYEVRDLGELKPGTFGVMEPEEAVFADWKDALVLVPGVAFDRNKNRMGYGGGYYDRYFERRRECTMLGVAYGLQIAEIIPVGEYDRGMDAVVTEQGFLRM